MGWSVLFLNAGIVILFLPFLKATWDYIGSSFLNYLYENFICAGNIDNGGLPFVHFQ